MLQVWRDGEISVWATGIAGGENQPAFEGFAMRHGRTFFWRSWPFQLGYVVVVDERGRTETFQGATFNLGLEVATAITRSL